MVGAEKTGESAVLQRLFICLAAVVTLTTSTFAYEPFPVNREPIGGSFGGGGFSMETSCVVNLDKTSGMYMYTIALSYTSEKERLLSWNALDWILSQYPNAVELKSATVHLFPLKVGKGDYIFRFQTKDRPMWIDRTTIRTFARDLPNVERQANNKEIAEWSGVTVSSYGYLQQEYGVGASVCLPEPLLVFQR